MNLNDYQDLNKASQSGVAHRAESAQGAKIPIFTYSFLILSLLYYCIAKAYCVYDDRLNNLYDNMVLFGGIQYDYILKNGEAWRFFTYPFINDSFQSWFIISVVFFPASRPLEQFFGAWTTATVFILGSLIGAAVRLSILGASDIQYSCSNGAWTLLIVGLTVSARRHGFGFVRDCKFRLALIIIYHILLIFTIHARYADLSFDISIAIGIIIGLTLHTINKSAIFSRLFCRFAAIVTLTAVTITVGSILNIVVTRQDITEQYARLTTAINSFTTGSFTEADSALADVRPVIGLGRQELALWRYIAERRAAQSSAIDQLKIADSGDRGSWEHRLADVFNGGRPPDSPPQDAVKHGRDITWYYFIGEALLLKGDHEKAREFFDYVVRKSNTNSPEYKAASGELNLMGSVDPI